MPGKRFSVVKSEARGAVVKALRLQSGGNASLVAVVRPWGQAFWAFEGSNSAIYHLDSSLYREDMQTSFGCSFKFKAYR